MGEDGGLDAAQRANAIWKRRLAEYEPPPIDEAVDEELREWIDRKKAASRTRTSDRARQLVASLATRRYAIMTLGCGARIGL